MMSKRFRDTGLWDKEWYVALSCVDRCAMDYILCRCDPVGVWCPAFTVAERLIGEKVDWDELPNRVNGNLRVLGNGKWWAIDFCKYQYGRIHEGSESKIQRILHGLLISHGLWDEYLSTLSPTVGPTVQEQEKEKELVIFEFSSRAWKGITADDRAEWKKAYPACDISRELEGMKQWLLANPEKRKQNYRRFITNWLSRSQEKGGGMPSRKPDTGIKRDAPPAPACDVCGKPCERDHGYWSCVTDGRRENVVCGGR